MPNEDPLSFSFISQTLGVEENENLDFVYVIAPNRVTSVRPISAAWETHLLGNVRAVACR